MENSWGAPAGICGFCGEYDCYGRCNNECYHTGEHKVTTELDGSLVCEYCGLPKEDW